MKQYRCDECGQRFVGKADFDRHTYITKHQNKTMATQQKPAPKQAPKRNKTEEKGDKVPTFEPKPETNKEAKKPAAPKKAASKPKKLKKKAPRLVTLDLRCKLSDKELKELGQKLADIQQQSQRLDQERKDAAKEYKQRLDVLKEDFETAGEMIREKSEFRPVKCEVHFDTPSPGWKVTIRTDTGEQVGKDSRMTPDELQMELSEQ